MCGDLKYSLWSRHKYDPFSLLKSTHVWAPVERFSTLCRHSRCVGECFSIPKTSPGWYDVCLKSVALRICGQIFKKGFLIAHVREEGSTSRVNPQTKFDFSSLLLYIKSSDAFDDVVNQILDIDPHLSTLFEDIMNITSHGAAVGFGYRNGYRLPVWLSLLCSNPYHIYSKASNPSWCALLLCSKSPPTTYGFFFFCPNWQQHHSMSFLSCRKSFKYTLRFLQYPNYLNKCPKCQEWCVMWCGCRKSCYMTWRSM